MVKREITTTVEKEVTEEHPVCDSCGHFCEERGGRVPAWIGSKTTEANDFCARCRDRIDDNNKTLGIAPDDSEAKRGWAQQSLADRIAKNIRGAFQLDSWLVLEVAWLVAGVVVVVHTPPVGLSILSLLFWVVLIERTARS